MDERTAAPLTDEEVPSAQNAILLYQLASEMTAPTKIAREEQELKEKKGHRFPTGAWHLRRATYVKKLKEVTGPECDE